MYLLWNKLVNGYYSKNGHWIPSGQVSNKLSDLCLFRDTSDAIRCRKTLSDGTGSSIIVFSEKTFRQKHRMRSFQFPGNLKPNYSEIMAFGAAGASRAMPMPAPEPEQEAQSELDTEGLDGEEEPNMVATDDGADEKKLQEAPDSNLSVIVQGIRPVNPGGEPLTYPEYLDKAIATVRTADDAPVYSSANIKETCETEFIKGAVRTMEDCKALLESINRKKKALEDEIFTLDLMTSDELHRIEFCNLDAFQGYVAYKRLHNLRIQRRRAKNELFTVNAVRIAFEDQNRAVQRLDDAIEDIDRLKQRCYRVRAPENMGVQL